ncbi:unnamed protein product [Clonostachys solani]|uniref:Epoxide hydrolase N-terminal domain-containing protein n=1 Tax=Clonostachys solani TaxID=160281 RepID=A0A9N9W314_9HYPO|nr:unnamed protein product [Clonostachys solani]
MHFKISTLILTLAGRAFAARHLPFNLPNVTSPTPFKLEVDQDVINFAKDRASSFRVTQSLYPELTTEGGSTERMSELAKYWAEEYDWEAQLAKINQLQHFATTVPGNRAYDAPIPLHFIHHPSPNKTAIPLLLIHGWPSSHLEWMKLIEPLSDAFHIIAADIPAFGFSPAPTLPGLGPREVGIAFDSLMKQLGYETYGAVITDIGWLVGQWMAVDVADSLIGYLSDFQLNSVTDKDLGRMKKNETTAEENDYITSTLAFANDHFAYSSIQGQKPLTLGWAMADSPVGVTGWYWDLRQLSSAGHDYSYDEMITDTLVNWIQGPYGNFRIYVESLKPEILRFPKSNVPAGITQWSLEGGPFPELAKFAFAPRDWAERTANVVFFRRHDFGGHFPALHAPEAFAEDIRAFYSGL